MNHSEEKILLSHGNGGRMMHDLITNMFVKYFGNKILNQETDAAILRVNLPEMAFTTDSFVIDPLFFPGGDIGKLAVCGTVNDLAVSGADPRFISVSFIIEEGFSMKELEMIVKSLAGEARKAKVLIVTGDTKVVNKGKCDKLFINTAGIGKVRKENRLVSQARNVINPSFIVVTGDLTDSTNGNIFGYPNGPYQAEWEQYKNILSSNGVDASFYYDIPGNHDAYNEQYFIYYVANSIQG